MTAADIDFYSDLSKDLYGTRSLWELAAEAYARFTARYPGETVFVTYEDGLLTRAQFETREEAARDLFDARFAGITLNGRPLTPADVE